MFIFKRNHVFNIVPVGLSHGLSTHALDRVFKRFKFAGGGVEGVIGLLASKTYWICFVSDFGSVHVQCKLAGCQ